jgi:hypothetical protein
MDIHAYTCVEAGCQIDFTSRGTAEESSWPPDWPGVFTGVHLAWGRIEVVGEYSEERG